jgi:tetratricopeptide (TPR) repeat protein
MNQLDISLNYFNNALVTAEITKDIDSKASIFEGISAILCDKRDYKNALGYMQKSEQIFKSYKDIYRLKTTYKNYVIVFTELNQRDSVAKYFDKFEQLSDSLYTQQSTKSIAEMQTKVSNYYRIQVMGNLGLRYLII